MDELTPGTLVTRGPDWEWNNQDGGEGQIGVIIEYDYENWYIVKWANGHQNGYKYGEGHDDIMLLNKPEIAKPTPNIKLDMGNKRVLPKKIRRFKKNLR